MEKQKTVRVYNPILTGFHADPSICMANGEYYIANSTFEWYPGVEISRSKDLVHWTSVPSPLSEKRLLDMNGEKFSCGIWAPCLSYSDGLFWLIYTNVRNWNAGPHKDCPNYLTTAPSIEGPWSDPVFLNASGFDASMFHDDDGKHWYINMEWDYRETGYRQFSGIVMREYDPKTKTLGKERYKIFKGTDIGGVEGPHLYKRNGWYYIAAAEGGTDYKHALTVGRSRSVTGPYEVHPQNPLISGWGHDDEITIHKAGHGSWCSSIDGKRTYLVYLCGRPLPGKEDCVLGRETALAEIEWKDDWPYVKEPDGSLDNVPPDYVDVPVSADNDGIQSAPGWGKNHYTFENGIPVDFKTLRTPAEGRYSTTERKGWLRMYGGQSPWSFYEQSIFCRRQTDFKFVAETKIDFEPDYFQQYAGMVYRYDEETQYLLQVAYSETRGKVLQVNTIMPPQLGAASFERGMEIELKEGPVWMRLEVDHNKGWFSWSQDGKNFRKIRPICEPAKLSDEFCGMGFTGAFVGMFCVDTEFYKKPADFEYFDYTGFDRNSK